MSSERGPGQACWEAHLNAIFREGTTTKAYASREAAYVLTLGAGLRLELSGLPSPQGAHASAVEYSLIETAKACGKEPYAQLLYALERLPLARTVDEVEALLPWNIHDQDLAMNLVAQE